MPLINDILGDPTKEFFIEMLTRDIPLERAIIDLIDNSIDGAKKLRPKGDFTGLYVKLSFSKDSFVIEDNCGGFPLEVAKKYAFRFGRPKAAKFTNNSVGRFGVGMKRALFKLGKEFDVESKNDKDHFLINVNVKDWLESNSWNFSHLDNSDIPKEKNKLKNTDGTIITVTSLYSNVQADFTDDVFLNKLSNEISLALSYSILKGIAITINTKKIKRKEIAFLDSKTLKTYYKQLQLKGAIAKIFCGVGEPEPPVAGWYIFCNDRLVLEADKSYVTGWKENNEEDSSIIKFHNKFAMFRGVVFFEAADSLNLPMTTTKTGVDTDHPNYKSCKVEMLVAMQQVLNFLKKIDDLEVRDSFVRTSEKVNITGLREISESLSTRFISPEIKKIKASNNFGTISYSKEKELIELVKDHLEVVSNREVGERTFDYFLKMNRIRA